ncbi:DUF805 domain-containing protein [Pseudomonas duriflava]|nr:DUF805 domain-containing protein [Pseudomonas duriflava]
MEKETILLNLATLFKSDLQQVSKLFKGPTTIKKDLSELEAERYVKALRQAGALARKEQDLSSMLTLVSDDTTPTLLQASETMICPKCSYEQPVDQECSACGIIIEKYQARLAAPTSAIPGPALSPYAPPKAELKSSSPQHYGKLKVLSLNGRIGRLRFLAWSLVSATVLALFSLIFVALGSSSALGGAGFTLSITLLALAVTLSIGVQRLHDMGWSGWLWLISAIPFVGGLFTLLLLIVPGNREANRYGPPPPPNSTSVKVLASLWLVVVILGILAAIAVPAYYAYTLRATGH